MRLKIENNKNNSYGDNTGKVYLKLYVTMYITTRVITAKILLWRRNDDQPLLSTIDKNTQYSNNKPCPWLTTTKQCGGTLASFALVLFNLFTVQVQT